jgi:ADP-heptose:LPS heptosyltransferase/SAM-dependent methyltransferase
LVLNAFTRLLGWCLQRDHSVDPQSVRCIVVSKFVGIGSILQATPLLRALRHHFPHARLVLLTAASNSSLVPHLDGIDDAVYVDDRNLRVLLGTTVRAVLRLIRQRVDLFFDLEVYSAYATLLALCSMARNRYGFYRQSARFKLGIYTHLVYFNTQKPVRRLYLQLGAAAGVLLPADEALGPLRIGEGDRRRIRDCWRQVAGEALLEKAVVVNPNASDLLVERRWPLERFAEVIERLAQLGHTVVVTGAKSETGYVESLVGTLSPETRAHVVNTAGLLDFGAFCALLEASRCVVTNDTGPMHLAIALGRPTVCLFGPGDPNHYGVRDGEIRIIWKGVFCSPCLYHSDEPPCGGDNVCMKKICAVEVLAAVAELLENAAGPREPRASGPGPGDEERLDSTGRPLGVVIRHAIIDRPLRPCEVCGGMRFAYRASLQSVRIVRCKGCGLERLDPVPTERELGAIYGRHYYDAWGLEGNEEKTREMKKSTFRSYLADLRTPIPEGCRVLDCGAATGFLMEVAEECGLDPFGVEVSAFGAGRIAERFGVGHVFQGTLEEARFDAVGEEPFSALFMCDFLEHVRDPEAVLRRAHALLASDGLLLITTPDTQSLTHHVMGGRWTHYKAEHLFYFSRRNLPMLLTKLGFRVVCCRRARKRLTLRYMHCQFATYRHWLLTPLSKYAYQILADPMLDLPIPLVIGEMLLEARKASGAPE